MTLREKTLAFLDKHGSALVFLAASALFLFFRLSLFFRYGLTQDEVLIISQIKTWDVMKIWHYYGFGGQGFFLQHYIFYILTFGGKLASVGYLRFICLAESFLGFCFLYKLAKKCFGNFAAFGAILIYALNPYQILYTLYIRFYALNMTLVIIELYFYFRALEDESKTCKNLAFAAIFAALAFCSHQFSVFLQPAILLHFIIWCLCRKPNAENSKWLIAGAALFVISLFAGISLWRPLLGKTGLVFSVKNAWLPANIGLASQRLQLFFWKNAMPLKCCSLVFLWVSLGLSAAAKLARRQKLWNELFLALGIVVPFFFLTHLHFSHFFAERYLAFWFPVWCLAWSCFLEFPAAMLENLKALENKRILTGICYGVFILVFFFSLFRFSSLKKLRYLEYGNTEAVEYLEEIAAKKDLPLILITEPDAASRNNILGQYYFDVNDNEGEFISDLMTVMRRGADGENLKPSVVAWTQTAKRLAHPEGTVQKQIGFHEIVSGDVFTNWTDIAKITAKTIPSSANLLKPLPQNGSNILDIGAKDADPYLLTGFSNDEFISGDENYTWCVGTNITVRFHNMKTNRYVLAARLRAIKNMRADFFLNGAKAGCADIATDFTNLFFKADNIPVKGNESPVILRIVTSGSMVPGRVGKDVFDNRDLSLCFDKITLANIPGEEELAASVFLESPNASVKPGSPLNLKLKIANLGKHVWEKSGEKPVRLAIRWYDENGREVKDDRIWLKRNVPTGDSINLTCESKAPETEGRFNVRISLVYENVRFFPEEFTKVFVVDVQKKVE